MPSLLARIETALEELTAISRQHEERLGRVEAHVGRLNGWQCEYLWERNATAYLGTRRFYGVPTTPNNADAFFRISFARWNSAFSSHKRTSPACSTLLGPGWTPASTSARSIQPRSVPRLTSSSSPTRRRPSSADSLP
ncbi:hypothetical protein ACFFRE_01400 [Aciditerrimonas ferrireducens]|uniref:Uncharacterized protein n=1 Tax=Aciditerrimonas ferrireducens TaxID=667306 RepID=A0ABV6BZF7_9ACTN